MLYVIHIYYVKPKFWESKLGRFQVERKVNESLARTEIFSSDSYIKNHPSHAEVKK